MTEPVAYRLVHGDGVLLRELIATPDNVDLYDHAGGPWAVTRAGQAVVPLGHSTEFVDPPWRVERRSAGESGWTVIRESSPLPPADEG